MRREGRDVRKRSPSPRDHRGIGVAHQGHRTNVTPTRCAKCRLTWTGADLLQVVATRFASTRADDGTWFAVRCSSCGRVTAVVDRLDGSVFGDASACDESALRSTEIASGDGIQSDPVRATYDRTRSAPARRRSHPSLTITVAGIMTAVIAGVVVVLALAVAHVDGPSHTRNVRSDPSPRPATDVAPAAPFVDPIADLSTVEGTTPRGIGLGTLDAIRVADDVAAVARIRNASDVVLPRTNVTFEVLGPRGGVLATATTIVDLAIGETKTVGVGSLALEPDDRPTAVRVSVADAPLEPIARPSVSISDVALAVSGDRAVVGGVVVNVGRDDASVIVSCAIRDRDAALVSVVVASLDVDAYAERSFSIPLPAADPTGATAACGAS
jgi:hypothetical protein